MRKDKFTIGDFVHVFNRGNRKMAIVNEEVDSWRFLNILRYFNNAYSTPKIFQELLSLRKRNKCADFVWPDNWPPQKPLVDIVSYCLMPNHFHLLLREITSDGIALFMKKLGIGYTEYINLKYEESGKVFQGSYKARLVDSEEYLQYVDAYIQAINPFELFEGGMPAALKNFDKAFDFAVNYQFCSLGEYFGKRNFSIINRESMAKKFPTLESYKEFLSDAVLNRRAESLEPTVFID